MASLEVPALEEGERQKNLSLKNNLGYLVRHYLAGPHCCQDLLKAIFGCKLEASLFLMEQ